MNKIFPAMSPARRNAEALLNQSMKREASFKWEQEREYEAMVWRMPYLPTWLNRQFSIMGG
jgi:hypothetical protein